MVLNGQTIHNIQDGTPLVSDFFAVRCKAKDGSMYRNLHSGIHYRPEFHDRCVCVCLVCTCVRV